MNDVSKADEEKIDKLKGVVGMVNKGGRFRVIIGNEVSKVFKEIMQIHLLLCQLEVY